jgi:hypothetical protein
MNMVLAPVTDLNTRRIAEVAQDIEDTLLPFQSPDADPEACSSFEDLVREAAILDADMAKCRAWYQISMYDLDQNEAGKAPEKREDDSGLGTFDLDFDEETMQGVLNRRGDSVLLVVSPMLVKWGDLDGKNFDVSKVLARKGVITA